MVDIKQWNLKEPLVSGFEDGCGCVSVGVKYAISKPQTENSKAEPVAESAQGRRRP